LTAARRVQALDLKIPPVGILLLAGAAMWGLARLFPEAIIALPARTFLIVASLCAGGAVAVAAIIGFHRHSTTVNPTSPDKASALVVNGIYGYTRNPMYLGLLLVLVAWWGYLPNAFSLIILPIFIIYMNRFQIQPEERVLLEKFGDPYALYMSKVRRWL
jgi:protein-S-isoprenylcysteine O-methyltransferase Ste14